MCYDLDDNRIVTAHTFPKNQYFSVDYLNMGGDITYRGEDTLTLPSILQSYHLRSH